jgi:8-oxo-dGTP pyrophosphatase MutT (NUDIX family)
MVAGSLLPVALHQGKLYFLFGKENPMEDSAKGWSDFGGGVEKGETPFDTAIREGSEELTGFLGDPKTLRKRIQKAGGVYPFTVKEYTVHLFFMDYDENLIQYYNHNHSFLWNRMDPKLLNKTKLFEKIEIRWFSEEELRTQRSLFRPFYREMVDRMIENLPDIRLFIESKNISKKMNKNKTVRTISANDKVHQQGGK